MSLTQKRIDFIENYLISFDATDSAKRAGYTYPQETGRSLLQNKEIIAEIQDRLKAHHMGAIEALSVASKAARNGNLEALKLIFAYHGLTDGTHQEA